MRYVTILLAAMALGCHESHHHDSEPPSPFAGAFVGTWDSTRSEESGGFSCSIDTMGTFTGTYENGGVLSRIDGAVAPDGQYTGTITPPAGPPVAIEGLMVLMAAGLGGRIEQVGVGLIATFQALRQ